MTTQMNWFDKWFLKKLTKKITIQSSQHQENIQEYYSYIIEAAQKVFTEDNDHSLRSFMEEQHGVVCNQHFKYAQKDLV